MARYDISQLRVLVVDDNVFMCRLVRTMLSAFGLRHVIDAHDGAEALERIDQSHFDILVVDWEMPVLNGPELGSSHPPARASCWPSRRSS
jgi:two-component system chemotaxis response regulator CheY